MPNRIIKESICSSDTIDGLSWFQEVLFYRLMVNCDDYGRFDGRAAIIKNRLFPLKDNLTAKTVSDGVNALANKGLVVLYEFEGKPYLYLPTWNKHQSVRAKKSKYPAPDESLKADEIICNQMNADVPVIQSNPIQSESKSKAKKKAEKTPLDVALDDFAKFRAKIKKPLTDRARTLMLNELEKLAPGDDETKIAIINQSIFKGWSGVYKLDDEFDRPVKEKPTQAPPPDASKRPKGPDYFPDWATGNG